MFVAHAVLDGCTVGAPNLISSHLFRAATQGKFVCGRVGTFGCRDAPSCKGTSGASMESPMIYPDFLRAVLSSPLGSCSPIASGTKLL
jgi:hypothetical protein